MALDLTDGVAGAYCTRLLAAYGANVTLVECAPAGGEIRQRGPFITDLPDGENGVLFNFLNAGKNSLLVDPDARNDQDLVRTIASSADVLITDQPWKSLTMKGLLSADLIKRNPAVVITEIPAIDSTSPLANHHLSELTLYAASGLMSLVGGAGKPPTKAGGYQASFIAGAHAAALTIFALFSAQSTGNGAVLEVPSLSTAAKFFSHMSDPDSIRDDPNPPDLRREHQSSIAPCGDGYVAVTVYYFQVQALAEMIDRPELAQDSRFTTAAAFQEHGTELLDEIRAWLITGSKAEIVEKAQQRHLLITPVNTARDLLESEHLRSRNFFQEVHLAGTKRVTQAGAPFQLSSSPTVAPAPAPKLGNATQRLINPRARDSLETGNAANRQPVSKHPSTPSLLRKTDLLRLPLKGVTVLDLSHRLAGPALTMLLADWGADVIKIEWWHRMDGWRGLISVKDDIDGTRSYNKKPNWLRLNRNKRSLTVNLKNPAGKQTFLDLAKKADVVIDNFSAGVMDRLGLSYKDLSPENPGIITISMPGFGTSGPDSTFVGNGPVFEGYSGLASITGYNGGAPRNSVGIWPDVVAGVHGATAIGMALVAREQTGNGDHIELAQTESLINMIGDAVLEYSANGDVREPTGNSDHTMAPHGVYPCSGEDRWIAIAVNSDAEWLALCESSVGALTSTDARFRTPVLRRQHAVELDSLIESWTTPQNCWELASNLQGVGVDAAAVATHEDFAQHDGVPSPEYQLYHDNEYLSEYPGPAARLNGTPPPIRSGPPKLGEHTAEILQEHLGMSAEKIEELRKGNAI
jgi:crotonobetainyl-CoA:carnitine CoA-transferase CaiB-like acyl-CoA transferase